MITPTVLIIMLLVTLFVLLTIFYVKVTQLKNSNNLLWQEYNKVQKNRNDEVDILNNEISTLNERLAVTLDLINQSGAPAGVKIAVTTLLKRGTLPS